MGNSSSSSSSSSRNEKGRKCRSLPNSPDVRRQLPVPYAKANVNGGTAIPLPATVLVTRRCPPDKVRPLPPTPNQQTGLHGGLQKHTLGGGISNSTPSDGNSCPGSPQHNGTAIITQIPKGNNSLRMPQATNCKIPASPYSASNTLQHNNHHNNNNNTITLIPNGNVTNIPTNPAQQHQQQKHSMLDKFKLFNSKEKQERSAQKSQISKRTSSSSGFSSARSERSDSSLSLDNGHHQGSLQPTVPPTSAIPGAKIKESGLKKLDAAGTKTSAPSPAAMSKSSSKLISSKSSSKESSKTKAVAEKQRNKDPGLEAIPQTHIPLAPQKVQKIPMATTVTTTSLTTSAVASAMASAKAQAKLASVGSSSNSNSSSSSNGSASAGRKLDAKSESKTSLLQPQLVVPKTMVPPQQQHQQQPMQQPAVGTGIPKPMAAIKGTSKPSSQLLPPTSAGDGGKEELTHSTNSSETSSVVAYRPSSESGSEQLLQSPQKHLPPSVGGVPLVYGGQPDVNLNSSNNGGGGSSSPGGGVAAAASHVFHNGNGNLHHSNNNHNATNNAANNNNNLSKFHTVPTKILNTPGSNHQSGPNQTTIYEQEEKQITVLPMRPLLRGYNSHVTLPTRGTRGHHPHHPHVHHVHHQLMAADYCEDFGGQGGGYCSDGDALRKIPARYSDNLDNGYLSEGGGGGGGASMLTSAGRQQHASYISSLRARTQLPTTIEER
uniref:Protein sickie n=1 Tax=Anopheles farauti TaxID=69004 RepID=A0A182Q5T3_9DIPT